MTRPPVLDAATPSPRNYFFTALIDAFAPLIAYFGLNALGVPPLVAVVVGTLVALLMTAINTFRQKRLDRAGLSVIAGIGLALLLQFLFHDPRLLLIKPSLFTALAAIYLTSTAFGFRGDRPLTYEGARPMATQGDPLRLAAYERAWERSPAFRALHRTATLGWAAAFLVDSILRVVIVYAFPLNRALWLSNVPHIAAMVLLVGFSAMIGRKAKPLVEEQLQQTAPENAAV